MQEFTFDKEIKILAIGNSFSDDSLEYFYQIASNLGYKNITLGNLYIGGCSLATHVNNAKVNLGFYEYRLNTLGSWNTQYNYKLIDALKERPWDIITMQQASGDSGNISTYNDDLIYLINFVKKHRTNPDALLAWNMTWAYQKDSDHGAFYKYHHDQLEMYHSITNTVITKILSNKDFNFIIPAGTAIQNVRTSYIGDALTRDGYHLTLDLGRFIAGCMFVKTLLKANIDDLTYNPSSGVIDETILKIVKEGVNNAYNHPFKITQSIYKQQDRIIETNRLYLRHFKDDDYATFYEYRSNKACQRYQRWVAKTSVEVKTYLEELVNMTFNDERVQLAIVKKENDVHIGDIFLARNDKSFTLGYTITPKEQRKGYAYEMTSALIEYLHTRYPKYEIYAMSHPNNIASIKLLTKLGFTSEGYDIRYHSLVFAKYKNTI